MREHRKAGGWTAALIALIVLLPLLYVLSVGPAIWLLKRNIVPEEPLTILYQPLEWASSEMPTVFAPLVWYVELWDGPDEGVAIPADLPLPTP